MYKNSSEFNREKYQNYIALQGMESFLKDKVYLFKAKREIDKIIEKGRDGNKINKILEIGCADGSFIDLFRESGNELHGCDISAPMISEASRKGVKAKVCDLNHGAEYENGIFDIIIATEVIEHIYDTDFLIKEINRIAAPNAYFILTTPNLCSLVNRLRMLFNIYPRYLEYDLSSNSAGHIRLYNTKAIRTQLERNGWKVRKMVSTNLTWPMTKNVPYFSKRIFMFLGDIFYSLGSHLIIVAQKNE